MENVPVHVNHGASAGRHTQDQPSNGRKGNKRKGLKKLIVLSVVIIIVAAAIALAVLTTYRSSVGSTIDSSKYQAVFFTNGQVYFGKLQTLNGNYMRLTNIYYLQTKTNEATIQETSTESTPDVQLIKLGDEIHGPTDEMIINNDQILFFENLKPDGRVTQSILTSQTNQ